MSFRSLLLLLDDDPRSDARMHVATSLAAAHGSHLAGLAATGLVELPADLGAAAWQAEHAAALLDDLQAHASERARRFLDRCAAAGVKSCEAIVEQGDKAMAVLRHAHCADLLIVGQADRASFQHRQQQAFVEQIVLHNARPTLIVPHAGRFDTVGQHVLVAWDDSRESARAAADAMPLLRDSSEVHVRMWRRAGEGGEAQMRQRLQQVCRWFERQGVSCDAEIDVAEGAIGDAIVKRASDGSTDLVVMGSYGHARWTERLLGGATLRMLERMTVPMLTSH